MQMQGLWYLFMCAIYLLAKINITKAAQISLAAVILAAFHVLASNCSVIYQKNNGNTFSLCTKATEHTLYYTNARTIAESCWMLSRANVQHTNRSKTLNRWLCDFIGAVRGKPVLQLGSLSQCLRIFDNVKTKWRGCLHGSLIGMCCLIRNSFVYLVVFGGNACWMLNAGVLFWIRVE